MARYGEHEMAARQSGKFVALAGLVYTSWSRPIHLVEPQAIPAEWPRYAAIDFGTSNPFACVYFAVDPADDVAHVLWTHYRAGLRWEEHAAILRDRFDASGWPSMVWADPEEANGRMTLAKEGIATTAARKDIRPGINAVAARLSLDANGLPHLVVHDGPDNYALVREIEGYIWAPRIGAKDAPDLPFKANDHAMDALRYGLFGLQRGAEWGASY
jgi:phage terminase large subunit